MSGFTKGPWEWWTSNSLKRLSAGTKDGAVLHAYRCPDGASDIQVSDADARLIAAAPELLDALERIARPHDCGCKPCTSACRSQLALEITVEEIQELARDAIAKAKGESA